MQKYDDWRRIVYKARLRKKRMRIITLQRQSVIVDDCMKEKGKRVLAVTLSTM